jgi:hypothetical protein
MKTQKIKIEGTQGTYLNLTPAMYRKIKRYIHDAKLTWWSGYHPRQSAHPIQIFSVSMIKIVDGSQAPKLTGTGFEKWAMKWKNDCGETMHYAHSDRRIVVGLEWL